MNAKLCILIINNKTLMQIVLDKIAYEYEKSIDFQ